jgi:hypothetical protein
MNNRLYELMNQAFIGTTDGKLSELNTVANIEKFAELIVEECRNVVTEVYRKTPLELCGPLLTADEEIVKHFYGVEE